MGGRGAPILQDEGFLLHIVTPILLSSSNSGHHSIQPQQSPQTHIMQASDSSNANDRDDLLFYRRDSEALPSYESMLRLPNYSENSPETTPNVVWADPEEPVSFTSSLTLLASIESPALLYRISTDNSTFLVSVFTWTGSGR